MVHKLNYYCVFMLAVIVGTLIGLMLVFLLFVFLMS